MKHDQITVNAGLRPPAAQETHYEELASTMKKLLIALAIVTFIASATLAYYATFARPVELQNQASAVIKSVQAAQAQATVLASPQYRYEQVISKKPVLNDTLDHPEDSWDIHSGNDTSCIFAGNAYHVQISIGTASNICDDEEANYGNFIFQAKMTIIKGKWGGIAFRPVVADSDPVMYRFCLTPAGHYYVGYFDNKDDGAILTFGRSAAVHPGLNQPNVLSVMAIGSKVYLYINNRFVTSVDGIAPSSGAIGLFASGDTQANADVAFSNARVWTL